MKKTTKTNAQKSDLIEGLDFQKIGARTQWYDQIGRRFFVNLTKQPLVLTFRHNMRAVEEIVIDDPKKENNELSGLEGQVLEEE